MNFNYIKYCLIKTKTFFTSYPVFNLLSFYSSFFNSSNSLFVSNVLYRIVFVLLLEYTNRRSLWIRVCMPGPKPLDNLFKSSV